MTWARARNIIRSELAIGRPFDLTTLVLYDWLDRIWWSGALSANSFCLCNVPHAFALSKDAPRGQSV
jgi:hypothetical protein